MRTAGGRLFVDVAPMLASSAGRKTIIEVLGKSDPLIRDAMLNILERGDFIKSLPGENTEEGAGKDPKAPPLPNYQAMIAYDPTIVAELIRSSQLSIEELKYQIQSKSALNLMDFIAADIQERKKQATHSKSFAVIMTGMNAATWINEKMNEWLAEKNAADTIAQSVPNNITAEMGLELLDVADTIRPYPEVIDYLQQVKDKNFLDGLVKPTGGKEARDSINAFLGKYGMRCAGEIDITKTRWSENPAALVPVILNNIKNFEPGASKRKFEKGLQEAVIKEVDLLTRLKRLSGGDEKAKETKQMINLVRNYAGYREYPKYEIVSRYFIYKQALLKEAERLLETGVIREKEDIFYLSFEELREVICEYIEQPGSYKQDYNVIIKRKEEYDLNKKLNPPRVFTSDGEIITGTYKRENLPAGALVGLPVSSGVIEGRARVILSIEDASLQEGDIMVTSFTDPSWTPLFVSIKGLVTEVGGLMTHGAVIAREYGLPAVVGVENATRIIKDGQIIRLNGTDGYIEIL